MKLISTKNLLSLFAALGLAAASTGAFAQATRTWVSGVGDDANPCSRTAPCKTFAGAISKTATGGTINVLDPGGWGAVTITKSITIDGSDSGMGGILASAGSAGIIVNAPADAVVTIRNLSIEGLGFSANDAADGIRFLAGGGLVLENVSIRAFGDRGVEFTPSGLSTLTIINSTIYNNGTLSLPVPVNGNGGVFVGPTGTGIANVTIRNSNLDHNFGFGLRAINRSIVSFSDSSASANLGAGLVFAGTADFAKGIVNSAELTGNGGAAATNGAGLESNGAFADVQIGGSTVSQNEIGLRALAGGLLRSFGNNQVFGNATDLSGAPTSTIAEL